MKKVIHILVFIRYIAIIFGCMFSSMIVATKIIDTYNPHYNNIISHIITICIIWFFYTVAVKIADYLLKDEL